MSNLDIFSQEKGLQLKKSSTKPDISVLMWTVECEASSLQLSAKSPSERKRKRKRGPSFKSEVFTHRKRKCSL